MVTAKEAAKIAYSKNYSNIDSGCQLDDIMLKIQEAAENGERHINYSLITGFNLNKLNDLGYSVFNAGFSNGVEQKSIQW